MGASSTNDSSSTNNTNSNGNAMHWKIAQSILSDADIKRLACCYFHSDHTKIDYHAAALDYGSASANSFRIMLNNALKKVREADANGFVAPSTPGKSAGTSPAKSRKRKADVAEGNGGEEEDDVEVPTPSKKRGRPKKVAAAKEEVDGEGDGGLGLVKSEGAGELVKKEEEGDE